MQIHLRFIAMVAQKKQLSAVGYEHKGVVSEVHGDPWEWVAAMLWLTARRRQCDGARSRRNPV